MHFVTLMVFSVNALLMVESVRIEPTRVKRGIFGTATSTVYKVIEEKHYVPASCVRVTPNLPDCRNVRFMNYPSFDSNAFNFFNMGHGPFATGTQQAIKSENSSSTLTKRIDKDPPTNEQVQGWGEYLGFYRPTVTITELKIAPTTVLDPRIMVTYDIRGCKPHELPSNMEKCVEDGLFELPQIVPTSTVGYEIEATVLPEQQVTKETLQPSIEDHHQNTLN